MRAAWLIVGSLLLSAPAIAKPLSGYSLTPDGIGPLSIGMTKEEAEKATGLSIEMNPNVTQGCDTGMLSGEVFLLFEEGKLHRISFIEGSYATVEGIKLGDSEDKAIAVYKKHLDSMAMTKDEEKHGYYFTEMKIHSHTYDDSGHYIAIKTSKDTGYMFETGTRDGVPGFGPVVIRDIHGGKFPAVEYIEGCL